MRTMRDLIRQLAEATIRGDAEDVAAFNKKYKPGDTIEVMTEDGIKKSELETKAVLNKTGYGFVRIRIGGKRLDGTYASQVVKLDKVHSPY